MYESEIVKQQLSNSKISFKFYTPNLEIKKENPYSFSMKKNYVSLSPKRNNVNESLHIENEKNTDNISQNKSKKKDEKICNSNYYFNYNLEEEIKNDSNSLNDLSDTLEFTNKEIIKFTDIDISGKFYKNFFICKEKTTKRIDSLPKIREKNKSKSVYFKPLNASKSKSESLRKIKTILSDKEKIILDEEDPKNLVIFKRKFIHSLPKKIQKFTNKYEKSYILPSVKETSAKFEQTVKVGSSFELKKLQEK